MSLSININLPDFDQDTGRSGVTRAALETHLDALGFIRDRAPGLSPLHAAPYGGSQGQATETAVTNTNRAGETEAQDAARRERRKPSGGRARRTKEEIAEDEAAEKADAAAQGISTGEERVGPEDNAESDAQDAADEAAEAAASKTAEITVDDLRDVMGEYVKKFTMEATQEDGVKIFADALGAPPNGESGWKLSSVVAAGKVGEAVAAWRKAVAASKRFGAA